MNQNYQDKINKIITVLDTLLAKQPTTTTQQQQEQQDPDSHAVQEHP